MATAEKIQQADTCDEDPFLTLQEFESVEKIISELLKTLSYEITQWNCGEFYSGDWINFGDKNGPLQQLRLYNSGGRQFTIRIYDSEFAILLEKEFSFQEPLLRQRLLLFLTILSD